MLPANVAATPICRIGGAGRGAPCSLGMRGTWGALTLSSSRPSCVMPSRISETMYTPTVAPIAPAAESVSVENSVPIASSAVKPNATYAAAAASRDAASRVRSAAVGHRCEYVLRVVVALECPRARWTDHVTAGRDQTGRVEVPKIVQTHTARAGAAWFW